MRDPRSILITGASSGIGEALALAYAKSGTALALTGRDAERVDAVAAACRTKGATVHTAVLDVLERERLADWVRAVDAKTPIDLVIANAGISGGSGSFETMDEIARKIFAVNVDGVFNTVHPALPMMGARKRGQIAIVSSVAGFRGLPGAGPYSASKAAVRVYGEALRGRLRKYGIGVSVICPGYVRSRMTAKNKFPMPLLMDADRAAEIIRRGLEADRPRIAFPFPTYAAIWITNLLPLWLTDRLFGRFPDKD